MENFYNKMKKYTVILAVTAAVLLVSFLTVFIMYKSRLKDKQEKAEEYANMSSGQNSTSDHIEGDNDISDDGTGDNTGDTSNTAGIENKTEASSENGKSTEDNSASTEDTSLPETTEKADATDIDRMVEEKLAQMTLREKVCQLFIITPEALTGYSLCTSAGDATKEALQRYPVAGVIYFSDNLESYEQTEEMIRLTKQYAEERTGVPFFVSVDEEGGIVARCADKLGTTTFDNMYNYREEGTETAYNNALTIATDIRNIGFNLDFAPVADTWSNSENTVIGHRAYSDDFEEAATLVAAAVKGFNDGGVICTLKHFPGHGDTSEYSHSGTAYSYKTLDELKEQEFLVFKSGIKAGADMVMVAHITMPEVDDQPAVFSHKLITEVLRNELGFDGVVITDALNMGAISDNYSSGEAALRCINAGADLLLMPYDFEAAIEGIEEAINSGELSESRIDESVRRILKLKYSRLSK